MKVYILSVDKHGWYSIRQVTYGDMKVRKLGKTVDYTYIAASGGNEVIVAQGHNPERSDVLRVERELHPAYGGSCSVILLQPETTDDHRALVIIRAANITIEEEYNARMITDYACVIDNPQSAAIRGSRNGEPFSIIFENGEPVAATAEQANRINRNHTNWLRYLASHGDMHGLNIIKY